MKKVNTLQKLVVMLLGMCLTVAGFAQTFSSSPNAPISSTNPLGITDDVITVSGVSGTLGVDVFLTSVEIDANHTWVGDLEITLTGPGGTPPNAGQNIGAGQSRIFLIENEGSTGDNVNAVFTPFATSCAGAHPFGTGITGDWRPEGSVLENCNITYDQAFSGDPNGDWLLRIDDEVGGDDGVLNTWSITFSAPCSPPLGCPSNITVGNTPGECGAFVNWVVDDSGCNGTAVSDPPSGSFFAAGTTTTVEVRVDDLNECSFTVTVGPDTEPPAITCPSDVTLNLGAGDCSTFFSYEVTATDNCPFLQGPFTLETIVPGAANNGGAVGGAVHFEVNNLSGDNINVTELGMNISTATIVDVYIKQGTFNGFQTNAGAWTLVAQADATTGPFAGGFPGNGTITPAPTDFVIPPGLWGITLHTVSASQNYTNGTGANQFYSDANIEISLGSAQNGLWAGVFNPRVWNGYITYQIGGEAEIIQTQGLASGEEFPLGITTNCFEITDNVGLTSECCFDVTVNEFPNATQNMTCNDNVQVSLDENCSATIGADMILEGGPYGCYDTRYTVMVLTPTGGNLGNVVTGAQIGPTWTVKVVDNETGQSCWGTIRVEDKLPPVIQCVDLEVACTEDIGPGSAFYEPAPQTFLPQAPVQFPASFVNHGGGQAFTLQGNNASGGLYFDLTNDSSEELEVNGFGIRIANPQFGAVNPPQTFEVFTAPTSVGNELDPTAWENLGPQTVEDIPPYFATGTGDLAQLPISDDVVIPPGESRGFYIFSQTTCVVFNAIIFGITPPVTEGPWTLTGGQISFELFNNLFLPGAVNNIPNIQVNYSAGASFPPPFDNCSSGNDLKLDVIETFVNDDCDGPSGTVIRTWTAKDKSGNKASCQQTITFERPTLNDVDIPADIVWSCEAYDIWPNVISATHLAFPEDCDGDTEIFETQCYDPNCDDQDLSFQDRLDLPLSIGPDCPGLGLDDADLYEVTGSGVPTVDGRPLVSICDIGVEFEDITVEVCPGTFKIVRKWTLIDWCADPVAVSQVNQLIKVVDEVPPLIDVFGVVGDTESNYGNPQIPALGNGSSTNNGGGCGNGVQTTGGTVFKAFVELPGGGAQSNSPNQYSNVRLEKVILDLNHSRLEDLDIYLRSPFTDPNTGDHYTLQLAADVGGSGTAFRKTVFSDDALIPIQQGAAPFYGEYQPEGGLDLSCGGFKGNITTIAEFDRPNFNWQQEVLGNWELIIFDDNPDNTGVLNAWKLIFTYDDVTIDVYNATASGSVHTVCEGSVVIPPINGVWDNCSGVAGYTTELWTILPNGDPGLQLGSVASNGGVFNGIPLFQAGQPARYIVRYYAIDGCDNQAFADINIRLIDKVPPIAICDEITEVSVINNSNGTGGSCSTVHAEVFDDGSYDNCTPVYFLMAKMDDSFSPNIFNRCYYPSRDFCCEDVGDQTVIMLVLDGDPKASFTTLNSPALGCDGTPGLFLTSTGVIRDATGRELNYNTCMVTVQVTDKLPPVLVSCPANQRISCDLYASNFETQLANAADEDEQCDILSAHFGSPVFYDNCDVDVSCDVNISLDQCLEGQIRRTWSGVDQGGNNSTSNCTQIINVDHVSDWVVEFPADQTVECGNTPPDFGEPEIFYETCELVAISFEDEVFTTVADACYKILRTWTVINWCVVGNEIDQEVVETPENQLGLIFPQCDLDLDGDCDNRTFRDSWNASVKPNANDATKQTGPDTDLDSDPWDGYITYQQTIKVNDTVDPVFTNGCEIPDVCIGNNTCTATLVLPTPEIDECSENFSIHASVYIGGQWLQGFGPFIGVGPGTYNVRYVAKDNCNNQTACETTVTVVDCKLPTPYCKAGIIVELMVPVFPGDEPMVEVWASDLDDASFDNCPGALKFSFSQDVNDDVIVFTCDDVDQQVSVNIWVTDAAGNQDFCETFVTVQGNQGQCGDDAFVAGAIANQSGAGVQDVNININSPSGFDANTTTNVDGQYSVSVPPAGDYSVTPVYDEDPLNGVSTFDLVLISKHILGIQTLDSPYKIIAADANKSNSVTTFDLVEVRKLILFINTEFPNNTSWRFVDKGHSFANPSNPFMGTFPEVVNINNLSAGQLGTDFVAVKVGDVNGNAAVNLLSGGDDRTMVGDLVLNVEDMIVEAGNTYTVEFKATEFAVSGYQFTLNFDKNALDLVEVVPGLATASNFGMTMVNEGVLTTSWNAEDVKKLATDEVVFGLTFTANQSGKLSDLLSVNSRYTAAEAYNTGDELLNVALSFNNSVVASGFELYQNTPNPFASVTNIGFYLPEATSATLTISDVQGKVVSVIEGDFEKGYNQVSLKRSELGATGVLYYRLDTDSDSATRKMILVD